MNREYASFLRGRYGLIARYSGVIISIIGLIILSPVLLLIVFPAESHMAPSFLWPGLGLLVAGCVLWGIFHVRDEEDLSIPEGAVIVVVTWAVAIAAGAVPFMLLGHDTTNALFESTSGWTTTGLSVVDVRASSPLLLFFRSLMQLAGGAGLAIIMLSSLAGPSGTGLSSAEGRKEQLVPHVRQSARIVLMLYSSYVVLGVLSLRAAGMGWMDAVNHSFSSLSTGGFSTRHSSIGYWGSARVEAVTIVLMLLGSMNFLTGYALWRGKLATAARSGELRMEAFIVPLAAVALFFGLVPGVYAGIGEKARAVLFQAVSAVTTTGFSINGLESFNGLGWMVVALLMLIGGGMGSTAGGIKLHRFHILLTGALWEVRRLLMPRRAVNQPMVWVGDDRRFLEDADIRRAGTFFFIYILTWLLGSCALASFGHPMPESMLEFASALGTVGLTTGVTSATAPHGQLWVEMAGMILGRLEFFVVFLGFMKLGRDMRDVVTHAKEAPEV